MVTYSFKEIIDYVNGMVNLADITWTDAGEYFKRSDLVLLPIGATEQHGPHSSLGTDCLTAEKVSSRIGEQTDTLVLPVIPVGISDHHRQFPGTLWVTPQVFRDYIKETVLSIASHGAQKIVIINGHGGNTNSLYEVCEELRREHDVFAVIVHSYTPKMDGHAGADETSIALYLDPETVKMDRAVDTVINKEIAGIQIGGNDKLGPALFPRDIIDLSETGVYAGAGKTIRASEATAERGEKLLKPHIEKIVKLVNELKNADITYLLSKNHK